MKKKILIGSIIAVVLLTLVSFSSVVGYSSVKSNPSITIITDEYDSPTPIQLVLQLITKLRNHKDIQNAESEDEVLRIIEGDEELNSIYEQLSADDCDCISETDSNVELQDKYPVICYLLFLLYYPIFLIFGILPFDLLFILIEIPILFLALSLDCSWMDMPGIQGMINSNYSTEIYKTLLESN